MKLNFEHERILAVIAHPDDAELLCAGTLARAQQEGAEIGICLLCQGDKGQPNPPIENLSIVRKQEMQNAVDLLGAKLLTGDFEDGNLFDTSESRLKVIELFRQFQPTLVLAHSPTDYHSDHRAASILAEAASWSCASTGHVTDSVAMKTPPALWWMDTVQMTNFEPHFYIDISPYVSLKQQMLQCHQSQLQRGADDDFSPLDELMLQQCQMRGRQSGVMAAEAFQIHSAWKRIEAW